MSVFTPLRAWTARILRAAPLIAIDLHAQTAPSPTQPVAAPPQSTEPFTVRVVGKGAPMILIPGLSSTGDVWNETVSALCTNYQCHVLSLAGFGGTPAVMADSTWLPRMRDAVIAYARAQRLNKPVIMGHSLGGYLALDIAATAPDLPRAIINVDGMPFLPGASIPGSTVESVRPMAQQMREQIRKPSAQNNRMMDAQVRTMVRDTTKFALIRTMMNTSDPATVAEARYSLYTTDIRPSMTRVSAPVLNLHAWVAYKGYGQNRERLEPMLANQYAGLKNQTTRISDTAYHFIMFDEPAWMLQEVRAFLAAH
ncbi:MAG: alpha/beta hydrolase [Gemmatimonadaceae bacterium]|nr:alpha/beta hydrolase [Gemmatimonadaceae bacterium]